VDWDNYIDGQDIGSTYGIRANGQDGIEFNNVSVKNCNLTDWSQGVYYAYTENSVLSNTTASGNTINGIFLSYSSYDNLTDTSALGNDDTGILLSYSSNNNLANIAASANAYYGIVLDDSSNNNFNNISACSRNCNILFAMEKKRIP